jgi:hypothetical protein
VQYDLRPAKQAERRMLIDAFHSLMASGFSIRDYQYTGMGAIYFVDFVLFHRLLGIKRMLSVEKSPIPKRLEFNKPFECVDVRIGAIGDEIPTLSRDVQHILWLDYDDVLRRYHIDDLSLACSHLSRGSIILITVDVEPPGAPGGDADEWNQHFEAEAGIHLPPVSQRVLTKKKLPAVNTRILRNVISDAMRARPDVEFLPLFNFLYKDGHRMVTLGGMLCGTTEKQKVLQGPLCDAPYIRFDFSKPPYEIVVPRLTRKERMFLDSRLPSTRSRQLKEFELDPEALRHYAEIYRFLPAYGELLV